ncbi:MAG: hypothetical protein KBA51_06925 [Kiritimatiellae bacterium]|nr:hypothetical protein [Kiritimatiellia bacterium]
MLLCTGLLRQPDGTESVRRFMISAGRLRIGPLQWNLQSADEVATRREMSAYQEFICPPGSPNDRAVLFEMAVSIRRESRPLPEGEPTYWSGGHWAAWQADHDWIFACGFHQRPKPTRVCRVCQNLHEAEMTVDPESSDPADAAGECPLRYPMDQILAWGMLGRIGGALLHASVAVDPHGDAWVFTAPSQTGKSTMAHLCLDAGWDVLAEDRVMIYPRGGRMMAAGTPWAGSGQFARNREAPLRKILLLQQAAENRLETLDSTTLLRSLLVTTSVPWFEPDWSQHTLDALEGIARGVDCARLHFTRSPAAVDALG